MLTCDMDDNDDDELLQIFHGRLLIISSCLVIHISSLFFLKKNTYNTFFPTLYRVVRETTYFAV
jgi:hypothetical protein